ncbi:hypothetical protein BDA99DRAFT_608322 [Phascolomyces articulosus]|uniref:Uncharacterized protein n=1 Tax=Phascolomyces articulosus TaxID=60185 RepID=A0AAD5JRM8_9FUNG|nr:hypothetical protein BDA99DRAFT_608322 [Phascolomyces articulosus]
MPSQVHVLSNIAYAKQVVHHLDEQVKERERGVPMGLDNEMKLNDKERYEIVELMQDMLPLYERIDDILPVFLQISQSKMATTRLIIMKYMFQDQIKLLDQNKFIFTLDALKKLQDQFMTCFVYVKNEVDARQRRRQELDDDNKIKQ